MELPFFGPIDLSQPQEYYEAWLEFDNGPEVQLLLWAPFEEGQDLQLADLVKVHAHLREIPELLDKAWEAVVQNYLEDGEVRQNYIDHFLQELDAATLHRLLGESSQDLSQGEQLLATMQPLAIAFYPWDAAEAVRIDFSIDEDATDQVVCVSLDEAAELSDISIES